MCGGIVEADRPTKMIQPTFSWARGLQPNEHLILMKEPGYAPSVFMKTRTLENKKMDVVVKALDEYLGPLLSYEVYADK